MKVAAIKDLSSVDGPGMRLTFFFAGCLHDCTGCFNKEFQKVSSGYNMLIPEIIQYIKNLKPWIDGVTFSGGDPLFQTKELGNLLVAIRSDPELKFLNIWMWTGYTLEQIPSKIKNKLNVIVDGKYDETLPSSKWRGSNNQKVWKKIRNDKFEEIYKIEEEDFNI